MRRQLKSMKPSPLDRQRGITLIESLIAILIAALGILGILGVQMRTLADTQTSVRRAQAVRLIEDLSERIQTNPNGLGNLDSYVSTWGSAPSATCGTAGCDAAKLAAYDIYQWKEAVKSTLPLGTASVFISAADTAAGNRRQLGVMVGWRENEREHKKADGTVDTSFTAPFATDSTGTANITCPSGLICHLQYIQPNQRCVPFTLGSTGTATPLYCPN